MAIKSHLQTQYGWKFIPYPGKGTYGEDGNQIYVPEMFGSQHKEFLRKFVLAPLENGQPLMGAVWSTAPGDPRARGFGKSTMMGEESKRINYDFGQNALRSLGVPKEEVADNPILASYVSFNTKAYGAISNIDAAAFHLTKFMIRSAHAIGGTVHQALRERAAAKLVETGKASPGFEDSAIAEAVKQKFRRLGVSIDIRNLLHEYLLLLASPDTDGVESFLSDRVGTWHHDRNGLKYLQLFVAFAELAGIVHFTFFLDQVEDFTAVAGSAKIQKNVKIIRDALLEAEPFSTLASFVFQLHPDANEKLRDAWRHEDLRSLDHDDPLNEPFIVTLKGLEKFNIARTLSEKIQNDPSVVLPERKPGLYPFTEGALKLVWDSTKPRPRWYLRVLHDLVVLAKDNKVHIIEDAFVAPRLERMLSEIEGEDEGEFVLDDRLR